MKLNVASRATLPSTMMDFSCVTRKLGLLHWTSIPVDFSFSKNGSFSHSPVAFAPFNMMRTLTPFLWRGITVSRSSGCVKVNCLRATVFARGIKKIHDRLFAMVRLHDQLTPAHVALAVAL